MTTQAIMRQAILATDGSAHARAATTFASTLAWLPGAAISVASVVEAPNPRDLPISHWEEQGLADWRMILESSYATARQQAQEAIAEAARVLRAQHPGVDIDEIVCQGEPAAELLSLARSVDAELVIAGTRGRSALECLLLGSVSEALVTEAPCPVLIVREAVSEIGTVLVALRAPADADRLAEACLRLPLPATAQLVAVTASAPRPIGRDARQPFRPGKVEAMLEAWAQAERAEVEAAAQRFIERLHAGDPDRAVTAQAIRGELQLSAFESRADVAPALLAEAEALGADLIVVGAREHRGLSAQLGFGSVSRKLVRRAPTAVLVVRDAPASV